MADYGVKISLPTKDVLTAGLGDLLFHSKYPLLKVKAIGSGSLNFTDGGAGFDVLLYTHNLSYQPLFFLYCKYYDPFTNAMIDFTRMPIAERSAGGLIRLNYTPSVNTTELRFSGGTAGGDGASHTIEYYWVVYYDPQ